MEPQKALKTIPHLTFRGNQKQTRYGWLRLTPAYSVHLVSELLATYAAPDSVVLDPFCGTGTTALTCAERGIVCDTTDSNPFLIWLAQVKTRNYSRKEIDEFVLASVKVAEYMEGDNGDTQWMPPLYQIEKWWEPETLATLGRGMAKITDLARNLNPCTIDLLKIAFCRVAIGQAQVSFGHQSMSFKKKEEQTNQMLDFQSSQKEAVTVYWSEAARSIANAAASLIIERPRIVLCDARELTSKLERGRYSCVITSPPYPNRMSYIRELRPYLYWLGYLTDQREAGELDWQAIGGTWGSATSNVAKWQPPTEIQIPFPRFDEILEGVAKHSLLLSRYIHKYFYDMIFHCAELFQAVRPRGVVNYIVGNSKFYDVLLPVEDIYASMFKATGFEDVEVRTIRKRTSKKELFEFVVSARKPRD